MKEIESIIATDQRHNPDRIFRIVDAKHKRNGDYYDTSVAVVHKNLVHMVSGETEDLAKGFLQAYQEALGDEIPEINTVFDARYVRETKESPEYVILENEERIVQVFPRPEQRVMPGFGLDRNGNILSLREDKDPLGGAIGEGLHYMVKKSETKEKNNGA